jgi:hypothetical protein
MRTFFSMVLLATLSAACFGCSAPPDDSTGATSQAALTGGSGVKLEKSRIEVLLNQTNSGTPDNCSVDVATFRVSYENAGFPAGTKVTLHAGESYSDQGWIGDGFGWGQWSKGLWGEIRDLSMEEVGGKFIAETTAKAYTQYYPGQYFWGMPDPTTYAPELVFVFRIEYPDGTVHWDNKLHQDYWVSANGPACPAGTTGGFIFRTGWGPY